MRTADAEGRAYSEILHAIITQKYAPGDHLAEAKIAEDLNMSRTPVRNVLKKMIASGILEYSKNIGCRIPVLTPHDMESVFSTRVTLEGKAAGLAAERATKADIERLFKLLEREKDLYSRRETAQYTQLNEELHVGIAALSKNFYLERFISQTFWRSELYIFFFDRFYDKDGPCHEKSMRDPMKSRSCRQHELLVNAVASGDSEAACAAMTRHVSSTYETMTRRHAGASYLQGAEGL